MNIIKQGAMLLIGVIMLIMLGAFNAMSSIFDWLMMLIITSDKLCVRCGHHNETITRKHPLCKECEIESEDDTMTAPHDITREDLTMYR